MVGRTYRGSLATLLVMCALSCGCGDDPNERLSHMGESCSKTEECGSGLVCLGAVGQQAVCVDDSVCSGLECGPDPVCGISCGTCSAGEACSNGTCVACTPSCGGKECGDDACGGTCGACTGNQTCEDGHCVGGAGCEPHCGTPEGLKWVSIPGGTFEMGCSPNDPDCSTTEGPAHSVTISAFQMLETEVTEAQYEAVMEENPSCNYNDQGGDDTPVECVQWNTAKTFCAAIGGRLPTEAEWEYAARGGAATRYYCGDDEECLNGIAWYIGNSSSMKCSVKTKEPNVYGLYDMLGNVSEWTNDWYDSGYYEISPPSNPQGPQSGSSRIMRGGNFECYTGSLRVSSRSAGAQSTYDYFLGFRCARSQ